MPVIVMGTTEFAVRLLRYTVKDKPGQSEPRVLHTGGVHCRPETSDREFAATRRRYGTQGARRRSAAKYELPAAGEVATHVRRTRPNGRRYWAPARPGEDATHIRLAGALVRQAEARHIIVSFGLDEVNHADPEQVAAAFEFVMQMQRTLRPGVQAHVVGQADGKGNAFHLHIVENATLYDDMEIDGVLYRAGRKLAGQLTNIDIVRDRADQFLAEHGRRYGLGPQRLASVSEQKKDTRNQRDRRMAAKGTLSNHDAIRGAFESAMDDPRSVDLNSWKSVMAERGITVTEPGWRRGNPPKVARLSYQLDGMASPVRAKTLGEHYEHANAVTMLDANANGRPRPRLPPKTKAGNPRPIAQPTDQELAEAQASVALMAEVERQLRVAEDELEHWVAARAKHAGVALGDVWDKLPESHEARMRVMKLWNRFEEASTSPQDAGTNHVVSPLTPAADGEPTPTAGRTSFPIAAESEPDFSHEELLDVLLIDDMLVQYGLYKADRSAMYRAGIEPRRITAAREFWDSLSSDEQRVHYAERKRASAASSKALEIVPNVQLLDPLQAAPGPATDSTQDSLADQHPTRPFEMLERAPRCGRPEAEADAHTAAVREKVARRSKARRFLVEDGDDSAHSVNDREFGE